MNRTMDTRLTEALVCPVCKGPLAANEDRSRFVCAKCRLAYPVIDGIAVMLEKEAQVLSQEQAARYRVSPPKD